MESASSNDWFILISVLGMVQGIFLASILLSGKHRSAANGFLAATMIAFSVDLFAAVYQASGIAVSFPHLLGIDYPLALLYGPFLYLYARMLVRGERLVKRYYWLHFLPFALIVLFLLPFYFKNGAEKLLVVSGSPATWWTQTIEGITYAKLAYSLIYIQMTLVILKRHRDTIKDTFSSTDHLTLAWLRNMMAGIVVLAGTAIVVYVFGVTGTTPVMGLDPGGWHDEINLLGVTIFVYAIGYLGLRQPEIFATGVGDCLSPGSTAEDPDASDRPDKPRYSRSGLSPERSREYAGHLARSMDEEKLFHRGDLTLQDMADALSISTHNLTQVINIEFGVSFYDYVNEYRVLEAKESLLDSANAHLTVLALGLDAGFNSKSSFNSVFKKHAGLTPSQFRQKHERPL